jgi:ATP-binding cassette subfamily C (CFTR/MRP) protein 1
MCVPIRAGMFNQVLHAPLSFFSLRQLGGVLDAFSRHQDVIDESLPDTVHMTIIFGCIMLTTVFLVVAVLPIYLIVVGVLMFVFGVLVAFYISTAVRTRFISCVEAMHAIACEF